MMINTEPTDETGLGERLMEVFKTRAEKVVFVKGDPALEFRDVARAIDIAKGAGIDKIGLMTPKMEAGTVSHEEGESYTRRWSRGTRLVCDGLREAEGARQPEQGRSGVQEREVQRKRSTISRKRFNSIPNFRPLACIWRLAYFSQYIPGAESPENMQNAQAAEQEFLKVLEKDPKNTVAISSLASLHYNQAQGNQPLEQKMKKLDEAKEWYTRTCRSRSEEQRGFL